MCRCADSPLKKGACPCGKASLIEKDFPRPGQILPAPGRNVTTGDKERNRCRASDKKGNGWHRISDDERSFY